MKLHVVEIEKGHPGVKKDTPGDFTKEELDTIAHHFNSYEKLVELIRDIDAHACLNREAEFDEQEHIRGTAALLIERIEQALEEAGKQ